MKTPAPFGSSNVLTNPFPGLRPFEPDEDHLFFGRDRQVDDLIRRLRSTRFLAVVGGSGSGKSSLVKSGLVPNLHSGYMTSAGSHWRVAIFRPSESPLQNLAVALAAPDVLGDEALPPALPLCTIIEATLRSGIQGLGDAVTQAHLPDTENILIVVDQFEELFRFQASRQASLAREDALAFVKILLAAASRIEISVYICLTMRSEYFGNCMDYPGLTEAINSGQYLVPRMNRDELRSAIAGPIAVGGSKITPGLITRLLNEASEAADQLPVLQHALMRTWALWKERTNGEGEITIEDYEATGTIRCALSRHADEAFMELSSDRQRLLAKRIFQGLTEITDDDHGVRRPATVGELCRICATSESDITAVIDKFRGAGRSFLMPPQVFSLSESSVIDLSHEALMRIWERLRVWTAEEKESASIYRRLAQSAGLYAKRQESLWRPPQLRIALDWWRKQEPNADWAERYGGFFEQTRAFLRRSHKAYHIRRGSFYALLALAVLAAVVGAAWRARQNAKTEERVKVELAQSEALKAQEETKKADERARVLQAEIDIFLNENPQLRQEAVKLRLRNRELGFRILEVEAENRDLEQRQTRQISEQKELTAKKSALKADIKRLETERTQLTRIIRDLESNFEERDAQLSKKIEELHQLLEKNGTLRSNAIEKGLVVEAVQEGPRSMAMPAPLVREAEAISRLDPLATPHAEVAEGWMSDLELRREELLKENRRLKMTAEELRQENSWLEAKLKPLERSNAHLKEEVNDIELRIKSLAAENAHLETLSQSLNISVENQRAMKTELEIKIRGAIFRVSYLEGLIFSVQKENETLQRIINEPELREN